MINSDLAVEFAVDYAESYPQGQENIIKRVDISEKRIFADRCGVYYDIDCSSEDVKIEQAVATCLRAYNYKFDKILFVGLGNAKYISDALGEMVLDNLPVANEKMAKFKPQVGRITGIESHDIIISAKKLVKPTLLIAVDSLATNDIARVGKSIQITNVGLTPGSGVGNARKVMTEKSLGVPVLAIGVPLVASVSSGDKKRLVIPIDTEDIVEKLSKTIANGIRQILE